MVPPIRKITYTIYTPIFHNPNCLYQINPVSSSAVYAICYTDVIGNIVHPDLCPSGQLFLGPCVPKTIGPRTTGPLGQLILARSSCPLLDASVPLLPLLLHPRPPLSLVIIHD